MGAPWIIRLGCAAALMSCAGQDAPWVACAGCHEADRWRPPGLDALAVSL